MPLIYNKMLLPIEGDYRWVDRRSVFGNPFVIGVDGGRDEVCDKFEEWIKKPEQRALVERAKRELRGFNLLCWCWPARCHAETWMRIVNE